MPNTTTPTYRLRIPNASALLPLPRQRVHTTEHLYPKIPPTSGGRHKCRCIEPKGNCLSKTRVHSPERRAGSIERRR